MAELRLLDNLELDVGQAEVRDEQAADVADQRLPVEIQELELGKI